MKINSKIRIEVVCCMLLLVAPLAVHADDAGGAPNISVTWSPSLLAEKVSLTITNNSRQLISVSPYLGVAYHSAGFSGLAIVSRDNPDKAVINPSVEFIFVPGKFTGLDEEGVMEHPVIIAPNETKTIKLQVPPGISEIAKISSEAILRLKLGDKVINVKDLKSLTK